MTRFAFRILEGLLGFNADFTKGFYKDSIGVSGLKKPGTEVVRLERHLGLYTGFRVQALDNFVVTLVQPYLIP